MFRPNLAADQNVRTALDHEPQASAMHILVIQPMRGQVVDENSRGALDGHPGIRAAAGRMNSRVGDPQSRHVIDHNVRRAFYGRANRSMRATRFPVYIHRDLRLVADPCLRLHYLPIVSQSAKIQ